ncbi:MAG: hypothetical protein M0Z77_11335 [Thermoplasmatales archaeon]|nr:hypothetical protein [Candidatus Thermoplasmatota archaeon]MCL6003426.1 hypothetical protein [Candidatus Thermoplasmatota archaeon]MDA8056221.1 hypothetical protein [Thermoplasmatales archaeon]
MKSVWRNAIIVSVIVVALVASFYATYYYSFNEGKNTGFNDGLTEGEVWTLQPLQSATIVFPNESTVYPLVQEAWLLLGSSQGHYDGVVHYGFEIWMVNADTGNVTWATYSNDIFRVTVECGSYAVSTEWINASRGSVQGGLVFSVPASDTQNYSFNVMVTAGPDNTSPLYLFNTVSLSIAK